MYTASDVVSSIFRKYKNKELEPQFIRDENKVLCKLLDIPEFGDPGRTCRTLFEKGFLQKNNALYKYNPEELSESLRTSFEANVYVYDLVKNIKSVSVLKIPLKQLSSKFDYTNKLAEILRNYKSEKGSYGIHYFGIQYAKFIIDNNLSVSEIVRQSGIGDNYNIELNKGIGIYKLACNDGYCETVPLTEDIETNFFSRENEKASNSSSSYTQNFSQIIYYGVPGSGKSHKIDEATKNLPEDQKMRVVFHPEYTNADFVGQILPNNTDGTISYKFKPGPFTKILRRAYLNPSKKYYLIIEEINRGNAAAIFGDVFQLLDRITDGKPETTGGYSYGNGWSRYSIENDFMNWYIRENLYANHKLQNEDDGIAEKSDESQKSIEIGNLHFSALTGIRLPPNLSLLSTMNTSDQNVFTLDNAFQRRWDMKLVENKFEGEDAENQRNAKIGETEVTWETFQTFINKKISESSSSVGMSSMEDKRLGCWFVKETDGKISKEKFAEKVLKYLWDDAFKFNHDDIFNIQENASFESIVEKFKGKENEKCDWSIFKDRNFIQSANEQ
ncbi:MAG: AAA family ATPase [Treponema sp.]|nr:AAA family ATPase [Treponema sp.]